MSQPQHISKILLKVAADPTDSFAKVLRECPFIQAELIHRKLMSLDDLTDVLKEVNDFNNTLHIVAMEDILKFIDYYVYHKDVVNSL